MKGLVMFAIALAATLSVESAFAGGPAQPAPLDADNLGEAVGMIGAENRIIELSRKFCNEQFPELRRQVDFAALSWRDRNKAEVRDVIAQKMDDSAASTIAATAASAAIHAVSRDQQLQYCTGFAAGVPDGARDVSVRTPRASQFLKEHLKAHPLSEQQARSFDFVMGCVKAAYNKGLDVDTADGFCQCNYTAMNTFSEEEWQNYFATVRARQPINDLAQVKRILPKLAQCSQTAAGKGAQ